MRIDAGGGLAAFVDDGALRIEFGEADWLGPLTPFGGAAVWDGGAGWSDGDLSWSVSDRPSMIVLTVATATDREAIATGEFARPTLGWRFDPTARRPGGIPEHTRGFGFQYCEFALPTRSGPDLNDWFFFPMRPRIVEPLLLVAEDLRTVLVAPLDAFHEQIIVPPADGEAGVEMGWHGDLERVAAGFSTSIAIVAAATPRGAIERWIGELRIDGPARPGRYADVLGQKISYWTDNGSAYWYRTEAPHDVPSTLAAATDALRDADIPFDAVQLDSWWYPHQTLRPFDTDEWVVPPTGLIRWEAREDILPDGIAALRKRLGDPPLVTHTRHVSSASPYVDEFPCWVDGQQAHPQGPEYYAALLEQARNWGVEVFEHDWLIEAFLGCRGLRAEAGRARAWQEGIDREAGRRGMTLQWCMASPPDFMQTATLANLTSIRTSGDHGYLVGPGVLWSWFCYTNVLARALGLWPFKDVFRTDGNRNSGEIDALLSVLSAGPVAIGDRVGQTDRSIVMRTCRTDGTIVRPNVPIAAIDRCFARDRVLRRALMVAETYSAHGDHRWTYVAAINYREDVERAATDVELGEVAVGAGEPVFVWDWRGRTGAINNGQPLSFDVPSMDWDLRVLAPIVDGIAVIGDPELYATAGDRRIGDFEFGPGRVAFTVFGAGETVTIVGWSDQPLAGTERDQDTGIWQVTVDVGDLGWRRVTLTA